MIVVLTRVNQHWLGPFCGLERMVKRRDFHEIRTRGGNQVDVKQGFSSYDNVSIPNILVVSYDIVPMVQAKKRQIFWLACENATLATLISERDVTPIRQRLY